MINLIFRILLNIFISNIILKYDKYIIFFMIFEINEF